MRRGGEEKKMEREGDKERRGGKEEGERRR